jgi:hypothetical protein
MATQIQGRQLLLGNYGPTAFRAAATLPATATQTLFTIAGGNVLITSIVGQVTTATGATVTNLKLNASNTAAGTNVDLCSNVAVTSLAVGTLYSVPVLGSAATVGVAVAQNNEIVLGSGAIRAITDATNTGAMKWYVNYISLDPGAYVVAA